MITDSLCNFLQIGTNLSLVGANATPIYTPVFDLLGQGVGTAPQNIIGTATVFGEDPGVGGRRPELNVTVGTALTGAVGTTLKAVLQAAVDQGSGGGYQPGAWADVVSQDGIALANISGGATAGSVILRSPFLPTMPANLRPRFFRLGFIPQTVAAGIVTSPGGSFTAGTISSALVTMVRDDLNQRNAARNYSVA